ncbi:uncharacterized protein LOC119684770 [Teleopsis dalmanni]|uniref:uncharacterized protein LOC119684770 n=1 Tax=Teleopsis dalmanni TaxID=139649 RepID=UPI000D32C4CF|nr:uncharacterized protein LOC119684770 [Teleopsis dalmanni]
MEIDDFKEDIGIIEMNENQLLFEIESDEAQNGLQMEISDLEVSKTVFVDIGGRSINTINCTEAKPMFPICRAWLQNEKKSLNTTKDNEIQIKQEDNGEEMCISAPKQGIKTAVPPPYPQKELSRADSSNVKELLEEFVHRGKKVKREWIKQRSMYKAQFKINEQILKFVDRKESLKE